MGLRIASIALVALLAACHSDRADRTVAGSIVGSGEGFLGAVLGGDDAAEGFIGGAIEGAAEGATRRRARRDRYEDDFWNDD